MTVHLGCPNVKTHQVKWNGGDPFCTQCGAIPVDLGSPEPKMAIVLRRDLDMPPGKAAAQAAHCAMAWLVERVTLRDLPSFSRAEREWMGGSDVKIVLGVDSQEELVDLYKRACHFNVLAYPITDEGRTVFDGQPTLVGVGIGPDWRQDVDAVTGRLHLY